MHRGTGLPRGQHPAWHDVDVAGARACGSRRTLVRRTGALDRGGCLVQSLGSARGEARKRRSPDALLKRGIAAPRPSSRGLPVLAGARSPMARSPRSVRLGKLGRDRVRGKWLLVCVLFLASALLYGAWIGGQTGRLVDALGGGIEKLAVPACFGVRRVTVEGQVDTT